MRFEFELENIEVWNAVKNLQLVSAINCTTLLSTIVYYSKWMCFWVAALALLTYLFDDGMVEPIMLVVMVLLMAAVLLTSLLNTVANNNCKKTFLSAETGLSGKHSFKLDEEKLCFDCPSGLIELQPSQIMYMALTDTHFLVYSFMYAIYIPLHKIDRPNLETMFKEIQQFSGKKIVNMAAEETLETPE